MKLRIAFLNLAVAMALNTMNEQIRSFILIAIDPFACFDGLAIAIVSIWLCLRRWSCEFFGGVHKIALIEEDDQIDAALALGGAIGVLALPALKHLIRGIDAEAVIAAAIRAWSHEFIAGTFAQFYVALLGHLLDWNGAGFFDPLVPFFTAWDGHDFRRLI